MFNSVFTIYSIILVALWIIEMNLLFGFKLKWFLLELVGGILLYFVAFFMFTGMIHPLIKMIWKDDKGMQIFLDNIPNYFMLYLIIKIIIDKKGDKDGNIQR